MKLTGKLFVNEIQCQNTPVKLKHDVRYTQVNLNTKYNLETLNNFTWNSFGKNDKKIVVGQMCNLEY